MGRAFIAILVFLCAMQQANAARKVVDSSHHEAAAARVQSQHAERSGAGVICPVRAKKGIEHLPGFAFPYEESSCDSCNNFRAFPQMRGTSAQSISMFKGTPCRGDDDEVKVKSLCRPVRDKMKWNGVFCACSLLKGASSLPSDAGKATIAFLGEEYGITNKKNCGADACFSAMTDILTNNGRKGSVSHNEMDQDEMRRLCKKCEAEGSEECKRIDVGIDAIEVENGNEEMFVADEEFMEETCYMDQKSLIGGDCIECMDGFWGLDVGCPDEAKTCDCRKKCPAQCPHKCDQVTGAC